MEHWLKMGKKNPTQVFSHEYWEIFKKAFFCRIPPVAAFADEWKIKLL